MVIASALTLHLLFGRTLQPHRARIEPTQLTITRCEFLKTKALNMASAKAARTEAPSSHHHNHHQLPDELWSRVFTFVPNSLASFAAVEATSRDMAVVVLQVPGLLHQNAIAAADVADVVITVYHPHM